MAWKVNVSTQKAGKLMPKQKPDIMAVLALAFLLPTTLATWMTVYEVPGIAFALLGGTVGTALALIYLWLLPPKTGKKVLLISAASFLAALVVFFGSVTSGIAYAWQFMVASYAKIFPHRYYPQPFPGEEQQPGLYVFLVFATFLLSICITYSVVRLRSFYATVLFTAPFVWLSYVRYGMPPVLPTVLIFTAWASLLLKGAWIKQKRKSSLITSAVSMLLFGTFFVAMLAIPPQGTAYRLLAENIHARIDEAVQDYAVRDFFSWLSGGPSRLGVRISTDVDLRRVGNVELNDDVVLRIRGNLQASQYLRGFSAGDYTGAGWLPDSELNSTFQGDNHLLYEGFTDIPFLFTSATIEDFQPEDIEIEGRIEFDYERRLPYSHMPYFSTSINADAVTFTGDAFLQNADPNEEETYFATYNMLKSSYASTPISLASSVVTSRYRDFLLSYRMVPYLVVLDAHYNNSQTYNLPYSQLPAEVIESRNEVFGTLLSAYEYDETLNALNEAPYRQYIEETYTQLPEGLAPTLLAIAEANGIAPVENYAQWHFTAMQVQAFMQNFGQYTLTPGPMPQDADFVEHFLTQSGKGYCVHYASAATTMLRALGVPARYVEGLVTDLSTPQGTQAWVDVTNESAHAWVEIWEPGLGWTPVEVTRGGADSWQVETSSSAGSIGSGTSGTNPYMPDMGGTGEVPAQNAAQQRLSQNTRTLIVLISVTAGIIIIVLLPLIPRRIRKRKFYNTDKNKAALALYRYLVKLQRFGLNPSYLATDIAEKAMFSSHTISEYELDVLKVEANITRYLVGLSFRDKIFAYALGLWIHV